MADSIDKANFSLKEISPLYTDDKTCGANRL